MSPARTVITPLSESPSTSAPAARRPGSGRGPSLRRSHSRQSESLSYFAPIRLPLSFAPIRVASFAHPSRFHLSRASESLPSRPSESRISPSSFASIRALSLAASDSNDPSRFHLSLHPSRVLSFAPIRVAFIFRAHPRPSESLSSFAPFESRPSRPSGSLSNGSGKTKDSLIRPLFEGPSGLSIETMSARSRVQPRHVPPMAR